MGKYEDEFWNLWVICYLRLISVFVKLLISTWWISSSAYTLFQSSSQQLSRLLFPHYFLFDLLSIIECIQSTDYDTITKQFFYFLFIPLFSCQFRLFLIWSKTFQNQNDNFLIFFYYLFHYHNTLWRIHYMRSTTYYPIQWIVSTKPCQTQEVRDTFFSDSSAHCGLDYLFVVILWSIANYDF